MNVLVSISHYGTPYHLIDTTELLIYFRDIFMFFSLGAAWKGLADEARKKYHDMAHREDLEHRRKYPSKFKCTQLFFLECSGDVASLDGRSLVLHLTFCYRLPILPRTRPQTKESAKGTEASPAGHVSRF